jgi:hypothetical protein
MSINSNLEIDQVLRGTKFAEDNPKIYSTGVYLVPMKIQIRGIEHYVWIADDFNDDTFDADGNNISARVLAESIEELYV